MADPRISDDDRNRIEQAIAAALLLMYRGTARMALDRLGHAEDDVVVSEAAQLAITAEAASRSTKIQAGINQRLAVAVARLAPGASVDARHLAIQQALYEINNHNAHVLLPYLDSWAIHQALVDTYRATPSAASPEKTAADDRLWIWEQVTSFSDGCADAQDASPASLDDLIAIAGGIPPLHNNCLCSLSPVN